MAANVLAVCTMNQCRSPMIELLLRRAAAAEPALDWSVSSAGTHAFQGATGPLAAEMLAERGVSSTTAGRSGSPAP